MLCDRFENWKQSLLLRILGVQILFAFRCTGVGCPHHRVSTACHYIVITLTNSKNSLDSLALNRQAIAEGTWRNVSPRLITAQAMRASFLAIATVTTRAGRFASNALIHAASAGLFRRSG